MFPTLRKKYEKGEIAMKDAKKRKAKTTRLYNKTVENMREIGTFKPEFEAPVKRYAELSIQYEFLNDKWYEEGCQITEEYTNKSGATNQRKTALYMALENLRKELIDMENVFGLTPKGLRQIKAKGLEQKQSSALDKALERLSE